PTTHCRRCPTRPTRSRTVPSTRPRRTAPRSAPTGGSVPVLFGKFRIQGKLVLLVLIPLLGVVALTVPIMVNRINAARDAQQMEDLVGLANEVGSTVQELNDERLLSVGYIFRQVSGDELVAKSARV